MGLWFPRFVTRSEPQIVVHFIRQNNLARIHLPVWVPQALEFLKRFDKFRPEHLGIEFGAGLSVAMLAGKRAAIADNHVCGFFHEAAEFRDAVRRFQIEADAVVNASVAEVAVQHALIAEVIGHLLQSRR